MFNNRRGYVSVANGQSNGRSSYQSLLRGRVTISGVDADGRNIQRVVQVVDGEIMDNMYRVDGKVAHRIAYGKFETKLTPSGRDVTRFHKGSGKGRHGKSTRFCKMFGHNGACHSWYKMGRLVRQKFVYDNGKLAYDWQGGTKPCEIRNHHGNPLYRITGAIDGRQHFTGVSVFDRPMPDWFLHSHPFSVEKGGKVIFAGQFHNRQKVGRWIEPDSKTLTEVFGLTPANSRTVEVFYEHGVTIPAQLYHIPTAKPDPRELLKIGNAQLRMAMLARANFKAERLAEIGRVIHKDKAMRLFDVPGLETRILRVQCPSTKSYYFIHVPHDSNRCEAARQWTFHVGAGIHTNTGRIVFAQET